MLTTPATLVSLIENVKPVEKHNYFYTTKAVIKNVLAHFL